MNTFQALVELQERDKVIKELKRSFRKIEEELAQKLAQLGRLRADCDAARRSQTEAEVHLRRLELERASENQTLSTTRDRLFDGTSAPTWREEQRLQEREQELMNRIALIDERIAPLLEDANTARVKLQDSQSKLADVEAQCQAAHTSGRKEQERISAEHNKLIIERKEAAKQIPRGQYEQYMKLWEANKGEAVAIVEREVCSGCSERLSSGELNALRLATEPQICHCGRFLITLVSR